MTYMLTGAHGFIGGWITARLESQGDTVIPIGRDVLHDPQSLQTFVASRRPDVVILCHAYGNMRSQTNPQEIYKANIQATWNIFQALRAIPVTAVLNISTSSVYGEKLTPMNESDTLNTQTFYGATKVAGEYIARAYAQTYGMPIINIRPFSVYGEGEAEHRFIPTVIRSIITQEPITLTTNPPHDWIHISSAVDAMLRLAPHAKELKGESVNVGTGIQTLNADVVSMLEKILGKRANVRETINTPYHTWVMGDTTLTEFDLEPKMSLQEGLVRCAEHYTKKYAIPKRT